jgi:uncharacterized RDD family membrane protein YckC
MNPAPLPDAILTSAGMATVRDILTPEGVPIPFRVATAGDRAAAFLIDCMILTALVGILVILIALTFVAGGQGKGWILSFALLAWFLVRNFYFVFFELRWQGRTPGKRALGIRVIDASGGPLTGEAIFARNLTRDLEFFLPLTVLSQPATLWPGSPGWAQLAACGWLLTIAFLPLFNRDRLRAGDLIAGTLVVVAPKTLLLADLSGTAARQGAQQAEPAYTFTADQLDLYGIYELQVLEELLRKRSFQRRDTLRAVSQRIQKKIGWVPPGGTVDVERFLFDFYTAQRARLEHKMLLGERQEHKRSGPIRPPRGDGGIRDDGR